MTVRRAASFLGVVVLAITLAPAPSAWAAAPTISGFSPISGPYGSIVQVTGTGFTGTTTVAFGGVVAFFDVPSDTLLEAAVPSGATTGPIAVTTAEGTATSSTDFVVTGTTCVFDPMTATASVVMHDDLASAYITMHDGTLTIDVNACPGATRSALDTIIVTGTATDDMVTFDLDMGRFAPGATDEGDGSSEIEISVDLADGRDVVFVGGRSKRNVMVIGSAGVNLNAAETVPDADLSLAGVEIAGLSGGSTRDVLWAMGGYGTGKPAAVSVILDGGEGDDIVGGSNGDDALSGSGGSDDIRPFGGDDSVDGGDGFDVAYFQGSTGIHADLRRGVARGQGHDELTGLEGLWGGPGDDVLNGDAAPNVLGGLDGSDVLEGRGSWDYLFGGSGPDLLRGGGGADFLDGEDGIDTCYQDAGSGEFRSCEKRPG